MATYLSFREIVKSSVASTNYTGFGAYIILPNKFYKFPDQEIFRQITSILKLDLEKTTLQRDGHFVHLFPNLRTTNRT